MHMAGLSSRRLRDAHRPSVKPTRRIQRRRVFTQARSPTNDVASPVSRTAAVQEWSHKTTRARQESVHKAASTPAHRAGLLVLAAWSACLILSICNRILKALGIGRTQNSGKANTLLSILSLLFPSNNRRQEKSADPVWPATFPQSPRAHLPVSQPQHGASLEARSAPPSAEPHCNSADSKQAELNEMAAVVQQASHKVVMLEQMVATLKGQIQVAERKASTAEEEAAALSNRLSGQEAIKSQVQDLHQQLESTQAQMMSKSQALATVNNEVQRLREERQLLLVPKPSAGKCEQEKPMQSDEIASLQQDLAVKLQQLESSENAVAHGQAQQNALSQELDLAKAGMHEALSSQLEAQEERSQMQEDLAGARATVGLLQSSVETIKAQMRAAEEENTALSSEMEDLQRHNSAATQRMEEKEQEVGRLQAQVSGLQEQLQQRQLALQALQETTADGSALAEQLQELQSRLSQVQEAREAALQEAAAAKEELRKGRREVAEAVGVIAEHAAAAHAARKPVEHVSQHGEDLSLLPDASILGLPDSELQERMQEQQQLQQQLQEQASKIEGLLPLQSQKQLSHVRKQLEEIDSRIEDAGAWGADLTRRSELETARAELYSSATQLLREMLSTSQFRAHEALQVDLTHCQNMLSRLQGALKEPLQDRIKRICSQFAAHVQQIKLDEVASAAAASEARIQAQQAKATAASEVRRSELEAWKRNQEATLETAASRSRKELEAQQRELALQEAAVQQEREDLQVQKSQLVQHQEQVQTLEAQYGDPGTLAEKAEQLAQLQQQLSAKAVEVESTEARAQQVLLKAQADAAKAADEAAQAQAALQSAEVRQQEVLEKEASLKRKEEQVAAAWDDVQDRISKARTQAECEIKQMKQTAAAEAKASKQELEWVKTTQEQNVAEAEAEDSLKQKVTALETELFTLKARYSRQFIDYKQQLDAAEERSRRLRKELADRTDVGGHAPAPIRTSEGSLAVEPGAKAVVAAPTQRSTSVDDVSTWASQLITQFSEEPDSGIAAVSNDAHAAAMSATVQLRDGVLTVEPATPDHAETAEVKEAAAPARTLRLEAAGHCIPHPAKVEKGGEDAHFILGSYAIGVADGVGGWSRNGIDPGEYSRELMRLTARALRRDRKRTLSCVDALTQAHDIVDVPGTCTAIVARIVDGTRMEVVNLGDSGMRVIRQGEIVFATQSLQHGFNMPYQLGNKELLPHTDLPKNSLRSVVSVDVGDVVVMASDGFFDNVWDKDLARLVKHSCLFEGIDQDNCVEHMAERLASVAAKNSKDATMRTPWSVSCAQHRDVGLLQKLFPKGGKVDDISIIVAQIGSHEDS